MKDYQPIIGLEVHIELKTRSKMFCPCQAYHFGAKPNTQTCPVCLGLPGSLPVPNKRAIDWCLLAGLALNCQINQRSEFDRKNYFYPDLPKGYQISQHYLPFCQKGFLLIERGGQERKIAIRRAHLEEDTAKLLHRQIGAKKFTLIDFNRSGVALLEIVSEPEMNSSQEALDYLKRLRQIIRYLGISDCDMEKGSMRCEVNISLSKVRDPEPRIVCLPSYKVEIKNLNSFRFVKKAIDYEIERQGKVLLSGKKPTQETRGFDEKAGKTFSQRTKEEAPDYRYFPEPDIPPIRWSEKELKEIRGLLPELPQERERRFQEQYKLEAKQAQLLARERNTADYFERVVQMGQNPQKAATLIINRPKMLSLSPGEFIAQSKREKAGLVEDKESLIKIIQKVMAENSKAVADFRLGKEQALQYLIGKIMKETKGRAQPQLVARILGEELGK